MFSDEIDAGFPKCDAPDFAHEVDFVGRNVLPEGGARDAVVAAGLGGADVLEGERTLTEIGGVGIAAASEVVIVPRGLEFVGIIGIILHRIGAVGRVAGQVITSLAEQSQAHEIAPALAAPTALQFGDMHAAADPSMTQAMGVFVQHDFGVQGGITPRDGTCVEQELHLARFTLRRGREAGVIMAVARLHPNVHAVALEPTAAEVVILEIAGGFGEAKVVQLIMHPVHPIEGVDDGSGRVIGRVPAETKRKIEDAVG